MHICVHLLDLLLMLNYHEAETVYSCLQYLIICCASGFGLLDYQTAISSNNMLFRGLFARIGERCLACLACLAAGTNSSPRRP